ncbi:MAG: hypothetical protein GOMPHAMPRED_006936 [Gomphillus americanus]|uniref:RCC1-like domain-containing protein n=1 Tax=Gomphillus americanus TaxID=1940652 RepID=A0A8H3ERF1_9LECA|nr:MAG: hypothetical protein GOMPHAMPRED_006936 [Gomphillus americanus]
MAPRKTSKAEAKEAVKGTRVSARVSAQKKASAATVASTSTAISKTSKKSSSTTSSKVTKKTGTKQPSKAASKAKLSAAASKKAKATSKSSNSTTSTSSKRKRSTDEVAEEKPAKKSRGSNTGSTTRVKKTPASKAPAVKKAAIDINQAPTEKLNCFVFGENGSGELGLGHMSAPGKRVIDVKRPRLNIKLSPEEIGVVQLACGGMHVVALTHDNKIFTWGVNDQGSLGRATKDGEQYKELKENGEEVAADEEDEMNSGLNPRESAPGEVDYSNIPEGTVFTKVAAGDSITMILTSIGQVYGCGTFRSNEGILGFSKEVEVQNTLTLIPSLNNIVDITCGANHVIALDNKGHAYAFGSGQQNQLGRRIVERTKLNSLIPSPLNFPRTKITSVSTGAYHSFAIDKSGDVWSWGLNSFGQTGISDDAGTDGGAIITPTRVPNLKAKGIKNISGGSQHSIAVDGQGQVLIWGRADGNQMGMDLDDIPEEHFYHDEEGKIVKRLVLTPTTVPEIKEATFACASGDTSIAVNTEGKAFSWGFSANYQTGQGTDEDVEEATLIDNTAVREEKLVWCGIGGQYGMLASYAKVVEAKKNSYEQEAEAKVNSDPMEVEANEVEVKVNGVEANVNGVEDQN